MQQVLAAGSVYWIPASAGMTDEVTEVRYGQIALKWIGFILCMRRMNKPQMNTDKHRYFDFGPGRAYYLLGNIHNQSHWNRLVPDRNLQLPIVLTAIRVHLCESVVD